LIDSDEDFVSLKSPGTGTSEDPYIIEDRVFGINETFVKEWYIGLEVINTTKHFIVRNCEFFGGLNSLRIFNITSGTAKIANNS